MIEGKLKELGYEIPSPAKPLAAYVPAVKIGNLVFTSGQVPVVNGEIMFKGKIGDKINEQQGLEAARICAINCLAAIKGITGSLDEIQRIVKLTVFVNSASGFTEQPRIANGASEFLMYLFGENGSHVRSAVGVSELPLDSAVEIEMIAEVKG